MKSIHVARLHKLRVEEFENEVRWECGWEYKEMKRRGMGEGQQQCVCVRVRACVPAYHIFSCSTTTINTMKISDDTKHRR